MAETQKSGTPALATPAKPAKVSPTQALESYLQKGLARLEELIPGGSMKGQELITSALFAARKQDALLKCSPESVFLALMDAAALGLTVHGGPRAEAALVPYKEKCTLIVMFRGYLRLMLRDGIVSAIHADKVCMGDLWRYETRESGVVLRHRVLEDESQRGPLLRTYAAAWNRDRQLIEAAVVPKSKIDKISAPILARGSDTPWRNWPDEMAVKTAIRQLAKMIPSLGVDRALEVDEKHEKERGDWVDSPGWSAGPPLKTLAPPRPQEVIEPPAAQEHAAITVEKQEEASSSRSSATQPEAARRHPATKSASGPPPAKSASAATVSASPEDLGDAPEEILGPDREPTDEELAAEAAEREAIQADSTRPPQTAATPSQPPQPERFTEAYAQWLWSRYDAAKTLLELRALSALPKGVPPELHEEDGRRYVERRNALKATEKAAGRKP